MENKKSLLYQAYGSDEILYEAAYSIISFLRFSEHDDVLIIIYTDQPIFFKTLFADRVHCEEAPLEKFKKWRGEINFVHRVKIEVILDCLKKWKGNFLYIDTDTVFLSPIQHIFEGIAQGQLYMHCDEGRIDSKKNSIFKKTYRFFKKWNSQSNVKEQDKVDLSAVMWNAGALGFNDQQQETIEKILAFTDKLHPHFPKHIVEQFAFSLFFARQSIIRAVEREIYHYWYFKEFREILKAYFKKNEGYSLEYHFQQMEAIDPQLLSQEKVAYLSLPRWRKNLLSLQGKKWKIRPYTI